MDKAGRQNYLVLLRLDESVKDDANQRACQGSGHWGVCRSALRRGRSTKGFGAQGRLTVDPVLGVKSRHDHAGAEAPGRVEGAARELYACHRGDGEPDPDPDGRGEGGAELLGRQDDGEDLTASMRTPWTTMARPPRVVRTLKLSENKKRTTTEAGGRRIYAPGSGRRPAWP